MTCPRFALSTMAKCPRPRLVDTSENLFESGYSLVDAYPFESFHLEIIHLLSIFDIKVIKVNSS